MKQRHVLACWALAAVVSTGPAARAVDPKAVHRAIDRGTAALRALQANDGTWEYAGQTPGMTSLAAVTLLECGAPANDPAVQKAAEAVRQAGRYLSDTYSLALAILFLDRLGDTADVPLIQVLAIRLRYGQGPTGGWSYECPVVGGENEATLIARQERPDGKRQEAVKPGAANGARELPAEIRAVLATYAANAPEAIRQGRLRQGGRPGRGGDFGAEDHSNTQFATLGLWVARRHGIPVDEALWEADAHYRTCQNSDGGWGYFANGPSSPTMTAAGVFGLAVAHGTALPPDKDRRRAARPTANHDPAIRRALGALGTVIGQPVAAPVGGVPAVGGFGRGGRRGPVNFGPIPTGPGVGGRLYYLLWSIERVAACLGLQTIDRKDWYDWGARALLANQGKDGYWHGQFAQGGADTCFALLFLCRSNLAKDLTIHLHGKVLDPGRAILRATTDGAEARAPSDRLGKGTEAATPAAEPRREARPAAADTAPRQQPPATAAATSKPAPAPAAPRQAAPSENESARLADEIVRSAAGQFDGLLTRTRDARGVANTEALAAAIPRLPQERRNRARDVLAERLSRMRTSSLAGYLKDEDAEIRRAAALALAMKESKEHVPDLIQVLNDPVALVVLAARGALRELTGKDFGPAPGATAEQSARAIAEWKAWWKERPGAK
jgi:hypothetical protein